MHGVAGQQEEVGPGGFESPALIGEQFADDVPPAEALATLDDFEVGLRTLADRLFRTAGGAPSYIFESQDIATASGLVAAGLGMALLPAGSRIPGTTELPIAGERVTRSISLTWHRDRLSTSPVVELKGHILTTAPALFSRER